MGKTLQTVIFLNNNFHTFIEYKYSGKIVHFATVFSKEEGSSDEDLELRSRRCKPFGVDG